MSHLPSPTRYENASFCRCGHSGLHLPAVSLGLWHNFGGVDVFENSKAIVLRAFDQGITHFDLANNYGPPPGSAEETFGRILKSDLMSWRDELIISTKAGYRMWAGPYGEWGSRKSLLASLDQSLRRMSLDYVDIFYSHRPDPETPLEETMGALIHAVRSGKALYAGVSNYNAEMTSRAAAILASEGVPLLIHQASYNLFNRWVEDGLTTVLSEAGVGCIAFSPLAQGLLTDRYLHGIPEGSRASKAHGFLKPAQVSEETMTRVRALHGIAQRRGQSLAAMALSWLLSRPTVTSVLIGASSTAQLDENLAASKGPEFSAEDIVEIDAACRIEPVIK
jgi:L-glyceraldehyde 3-phosphate reductase